MFKIMQDGICYTKNLATLPDAHLAARECLLNGDPEPNAVFIVHQKTGKKIEKHTIEVCIEILAVMVLSEYGNESQG